MNIYEEWGFSESPFQTTALPASSFGETLLVGRDKELQMLKRRIYNPPKIATIEGLNGIGKTSLVNVAAYQAFQGHINDEKLPLLIPCQEIFQLNPNKSLDAFTDEVLLSVAQTLLNQARALLDDGISSRRTNAIDAWLNSPQLETFQGNLGPVGFGRSAEMNTSEGFLRSGFRNEITRWLKELFPSPSDGGVICTIDNLELLQTSQTARNILEQLRDELLTLPGLRWILCGSLGVVLGVASSPRLEGYLHSPLEIGGIDDSLAGEILSSRIDAYTFRNSTYLPIIEQDFVDLYHLLKGNVRGVLAQADNYCQWIADRELPSSDNQKHNFFREWLDRECTNALNSVHQQLRPRAWEIFEHAVAIGGTFSPSDYDKFGANSVSAIRPHVKDLEDVGLLRSTQDEGDKRRKTIQITTKGWLVTHARTLFSKVTNTILIVSANPFDTDRLAVDQSFRSIERELRTSAVRQNINLESRWVTRINDLQELLLRYAPTIVHFKGHGSSSGQIMFADDNDVVRVVSPAALGSLFRILKDNIRCVVLDGCYSEEQAQHIAEYIDAVVSLPAEINDEQAIVFISGFYRAVIYGRDIEAAFNLGCNSLDLHDLDQDKKPLLIANHTPPNEIRLFLLEREIKEK
jgi:hypothetical protein